MALFTYVATAGESGTSISTIVTSMQSSFQSTANEMMSAVGNILPILLPIVGAIAVIFLGVRLFKRLSKG